jgi:hypothetical protein
VWLAVITRRAATGSCFSHAAWPAIAAPPPAKNTPTAPLVVAGTHERGDHKCCDELLSRTRRGRAKFFNDFDRTAFSPQWSHHSVQARAVLIARADKLDAACRPASHRAQCHDDSHAVRSASLRNRGSACTNFVTDRGKTKCGRRDVVRRDQQFPPAQLSLSQRNMRKADAHAIDVGEFVASAPWSITQPRDLACRAHPWPCIQQPIATE